MAYIDMAYGIMAYGIMAYVVMATDVRRCGIIDPAADQRRRDAHGSRAALRIHPARTRAYTVTMARQRPAWLSAQQARKSDRRRRELAAVRTNSVDDRAHTGA